MVRLSDSPDEWTSHVHTSGRHFLTNPCTSETRWLWQKWDLNGRLFVRNIADPNIRIWVDDMDLPTRLAAGMASPEEVEQHRRMSQYAPPVPPPPPSMQQSFVNTPPVYHHIQRPFQHPQNRYNLRQQPLNGFAPPRTTTAFNPALANGAPRVEPSNILGSLLVQPANNRSQTHTFANDAPRPPFSPLVDARSGPFAAHDGVVNGEGRYWAYATQRTIKKQKNVNQYDSKHRNHRSRFAPLTHRSVEQWPSRAPPPPLQPELAAVKRKLSETATMPKVARVLYSACLKVTDGDKVAALYERDFRGTAGEGGRSPCSVRAQNGDEELIFEPVVGTCETVEKDFLRLTTAPKPEMVRPPRVLKEAVKRVKIVWAEGERDYDWVCRQLKSIRQDYKVQYVEDADAVDAYETHARIALERGDLGEFNTCVAQVQELYKKVGQDEHVQDEFASYRILYNLLVGASEWEQGKILAQFSSTERNRTATRFALRIRQAVISGNYHNYFRLSFDTPPKTMISYLLVHFHDQMRCRALSTMAAAYGPGQPGRIPLHFVFDQLGWYTDNAVVDGPEGDRVRQEFKEKSADAGLLPALDSLDILDQSPSSLVTLTFLLKVGAVLVVDDNDKPVLERIHLDCKATKESGIQLAISSKKLITHAGSER